MSIPDHISNKHSFPNNKKYLACPHESFVGERARAWLDPDSVAVKKVRAALNGPDGSRIRDLPYMVEFTHTGAIENWNSLHNKYANKNYQYGYRGMLVRAALSALDHNSNCDREQAKTVDGRLRYDMLRNRYGSKWIVRKVKSQKDHTWREDIAYLVLKSLEIGRVPKIELPVGTEKDNIRVDAPRPSKEEAVRHHQSRMVKS